MCRSFRRKKKKKCTRLGPGYVYPGPASGASGATQNVQVSCRKFTSRSVMLQINSESGLSFFVFAKGGPKIQNTGFWPFWPISEGIRLAFFSIFSIFFLYIFWKLYAYWVRIWPWKIHPDLGSGLKWLPKFQNGQKLHSLTSKSALIKQLF